MNETPRKSRSEQLISEPAQRGVFHALRRDSIPRLIVEWLLILAAILCLLVMTGCAGPSDTEAAQMIAEDAAEAEQVRWMLVQISGERPADISPEDWRAAQHAVKGMQ